MKRKNNALSLQAGKRIEQANLNGKENQDL